jgi:hypothetical protein
VNCALDLGLATAQNPLAARTSSIKEKPCSPN